MPELLRFKSCEGSRNNLPRAIAMHFASHKWNLAKNAGGAKWTPCIGNFNL